MKTKKKVVISLIIIIILFALAVFKSVCMDIGPREYPDLEIAYEKVSDEENFYNRLAEMEKKLHWPDNVYEEFGKMNNGKSFDRLLLLDAVEKNRELFTYIEKALECKYFQTPLYKSYEEMDTLFQWFNFPEPMSGHIMLAKGVEKNAALELYTNFAAKCAKVGTHDFMSTVHAYSVVFGYYNFVREQLTTFSNKEINYILDEIEQWTNRQENYVNSAKAEFAFFRNMLQNHDLNQLAEGLGYKLSSRFTIHLNRTIHSAAKITRETLKAIDQGQLSLPPSNTGSSNLGLNTNYHGRKLIREHFSTWETILGISLQLDAKKSATILALNCELYRRKHGDLPDTLDDLVPDYIKAVPADPFDGKPLRYDKKKKIIYSVGENQKDDGGNENHDTVFKL